MNSGDDLSVTIDVVMINRYMDKIRYHFDEGYTHSKEMKIVDFLVLVVFHLLLIIVVCYIPWFIADLWDIYKINMGYAVIQYKCY